jgi:hypothetical protein
MLWIRTGFRFGSGRKEKKLTVGFLYTIFNALLVGLLESRSVYKRSLQPSKKNIQHFKTCFLGFFLALLDRDPDPHSQFGSDPHPDPTDQKAMQILVDLDSQTLPLILTQSLKFSQFLQQVLTTKATFDNLTAGHLLDNCERREMRLSHH